MRCWWEVCLGLGGGGDGRLTVSPLCLLRGPRVAGPGTAVQTGGTEKSEFFDAAETS